MSKNKIIIYNMNHDDNNSMATSDTSVSDLTGPVLETLKVAKGHQLKSKTRCQKPMMTYRVWERK